MLGLPVFWVVSFLIYCVRCALFGMDRTPRIDEVVRTPWLPRIFMEFGYWMFRIPVRICIALGITPNMITFGSLVLTVVAAVAVSQGYFALGGWTLLFAFTCDSWDGIVARATGTVSVTGEFFDSTIDRYNDLITFLGFMYYYRNDQLPLFIVLLAMLGSTLVSYTRAKGKAAGVDPNVGYMQRHERAVWIGVSTALSPILAAFVEPDAAHPVYHMAVVVMAVVAIMTNITAIWRIRFVMAELRRLSSKAPHGAMK
ncbi:MAG: CDP-alcohol phosphatidyltransferase family protein [Myxococcales bacterium]|nr:CDP-alcohol phosphatidyltransferase family protein [Myxococcota bacterium]MDW8283776.1 CDP-alcohol phosphatidyltransferase family protein [Myxococcales bacterium]